MSNNSEAVKRWRKSMKQRVVDSMGGCCQICKYDRCTEALELHHLDPSEKEFGLGQIVANPKSWSKITEELRKCILLCANCHRELHQDYVQLPETFQRFDEAYVDYKASEKADLYDACPCCGKSKPTKNSYCSVKCAGTSNGKVNWREVNLPSMLTTMNYTQIGRQYGVTGAAVKKQAKKLGLV